MDKDWQQGIAVFYSFSQYPGFQDSFWYSILSHKFIANFINYFIIFQQEQVDFSKVGLSFTVLVNLTKIILIWHHNSCITSQLINRGRFNIIEEKDADSQQKLVQEVNTGIFLLPYPLASNWLKKLKKNIIIRYISILKTLRYWNLMLIILSL